MGRSIGELIKEAQAAEQARAEQARREYIQRLREQEDDRLDLFRGSFSDETQAALGAMWVPEREDDTSEPQVHFTVDSIDAHVWACSGLGDRLRWFLTVGDYARPEGVYQSRHDFEQNFLLALGEALDREKAIRSLAGD
jgi:hypothetical protein